MRIPLRISSIVKILVLVFIVVFILRAFFWLDIRQRCFIKILPSLTEFSNFTVKRALSILKHAAPAEYSDLCTYVKTISPNISHAGFGGGHYQTRNPGSITVYSSQRSITNTLMVIVHETCHAKQHRELRPFDEEECYAAGDEAMDKIIRM